MSETPAITWTGQSGEKYNYGILPIETALKEQPGNYIFAKETTPNHWKACYIGQTENLNKRTGDHEKEDCAKREGATHIHAHINNDGEQIRRAEEKDLILKWQPPCNEQYVD